MSISPILLCYREIEPCSILFSPVASEHSDQSHEPAFILPFQCLLNYSCSEIVMGHILIFFSARIAKFPGKYSEHLPFHTPPSGKCGSKDENKAIDLRTMIKRCRSNIWITSKTFHLCKMIKKRSDMVDYGQRLFFPLAIWGVILAWDEPH